MPDMLCSLTRLPAIEPVLAPLRDEGITIRRPHPWERPKVVAFIKTYFTEGWSEETQTAFYHQPVTAFIALQDNEIVGFAAYECTRKDYFGPTGVLESMRGKGVGKALFLAALYGLQDLGYTYAIIGGAGPVDFYKKVVGAIVIPFDEGRGIYDLKEDPKFLSR